MEWNIMDIKVRTENNYVVEVMASCKHTEGRGKSIVVHTSNFTGEPDQNFIPFEELTKEQVLNWVKEDLGADEVNRIETKVVYEATERNNYLNNSTIQSKQLNT
jgi:hypothetical protein